MSNNLYHFDVLPIHPKPKEFESLTSYFVRLAKANSVQSVLGMSAICFPDQAARVTRKMSDYPPVSFGNLPQVACCSKQRLLATTFYHLGSKFGRVPHPQNLSRFLSGSVAKYLRYCPLCIAESPYHSLIWRFSTVNSCHIHQHQLLDRCCHCKQAIPLLKIPAKIGTCPHCSESLGKCVLEYVDEVELLLAKRRVYDLHYLLSFQFWEITLSDQVMGYVGQQLAHIRNSKNLTAKTVAIEAEIDLNHIYTMEVGRLDKGGAKFVDYLKYAEYFGLTLRDIFEQALVNQWERNLQQLDETTLLEQVTWAIHTLSLHKRPVTQIAISEIVGLSPGGLYHYPRVRELLARVAAINHAERHRQYTFQKQNTVNQVHKAIDKRSQDAKALTQHEICETVNMPLSTLKVHPEIRATFYELSLTNATKQQDQFLVRQEELLDLVQKALETLIALKLPITQRAISREVGVSRSGLMYYPKLRELIYSVTGQRKRISVLHEYDLLTAVKDAAKNLELLELPVTQKALADAVDMSVSGLKQYPMVRAFLEDAAATRRQMASARAQLRESELADAMKAARQLLQRQNLPITQQNVSDIVGVSVKCLRSYEKTKAILADIAAQSS